VDESHAARTICAFARPRGLSLKVSDEFTVPLCRAHHRELHRAGKEVDWWSKKVIQPTRDRARALAWLSSAYIEN
jgi:hypothetical protein